MSDWTNLLGDIFDDGALHSLALLLFIALIPFFSLGAVWGIRRNAQKRMQSILDVFSSLSNTTSYKIFIINNSKIKTIRYLMPLGFLFCLNFFMSMILLDGGHWTDNAISASRKVFLLCGSHCVDHAPTFNLGDYETSTLVFVSYAFVGWMVWSFITIFDRAATQQLFPATFNRLLVRLAVAVLVAIMVRHLVVDTQTASAVSGPALAFAVGMFPQRGLALISSKVDDLLKDKERSEDFSLALIEGIDPTMTYRLEELGIGSCADLARANPFGIFEAAAIPMTEVIDWIAQAQLLLLVKSDRFQTLQKASYRTIFDAVRLLHSPGGATWVKTLCNWTIPDNYDQAAAIAACSDYQRLLEVAESMGMIKP